jgi:Flp pilus assembly protein TadB
MWNGRASASSAEEHERGWIFRRRGDRVPGMSPYRMFSLLGVAIVMVAVMMGLTVVTGIVVAVMGWRANH